MPARAEVRGRWRGWVSLGFVLGLITGAALAAAALRTRTVRTPGFPRAHGAADTIVYMSARGTGGPAGELVGSTGPRS